MFLRAALLASAVSLFYAHVAAAAPLMKLPFKDGSGNEAVIEPPVLHPNETPCIVPLYHNAQFGANNVNFLYKPPANCPGPYSTIVLSVDVSLDAGIQYDRTGTIWIGGVPLWFGTTAEPNPQLGPSWHFERDVTDYTSLLEGTNPGFVLIANYTNNQDTSIITSSAKLLFYPVPNGGTAPTVPDVIIPLAANGGGTVALNAGTDTVAIDQELPTNIASARLDVFLQGQSTDEFWYTCVPASLSGELESCPGTAYREGEITVDGTPAGVAPVYPWIFTGGIDPYLWAPIPGVQTLNFKPFQVPLTPFAGQLSNGAVAHQIALSVYNADSYFSVAGALLLFLDHGGSQVTGSVTQNTLAASPSPKIVSTIANRNGVLGGHINTTSHRNFTISGTVVTSAGSGQFTVTQTTGFTNDQKFKISNTVYEQLISQSTDTVVKTTAVDPSGTTDKTVKLTYPLTVEIVQTTRKNGDIAQATSIVQDYQADKLIDGPTGKTHSLLQDSINTADTLLFTSQGGFLGHSGQKETADYASKGTGMPCFARTLMAAKNVLTSAQTGCHK
jgi:hypothetical protein